MNATLNNMIVIRTQYVSVRNLDINVNVNLDLKNTIMDENALVMLFHFSCMLLRFSLLLISSTLLLC